MTQVKKFVLNVAAIKKLNVIAQAGLAKKVLMMIALLAAVAVKLLALAAMVAVGFM